MSSKKSFSSAPKPQTTQPSPETIAAFEQGGAGHDAKPVTANPPPRETRASDEPSKRLSVDIPASVHKRFKTACSAAETQMTVELLRFIERRTAELEKKALTHS
jgi:hypothetical protein